MKGSHQPLTGRRTSVKNMGLVVHRKHLRECITLESQVIKHSNISIGLLSNPFI